MTTAIQNFLHELEQLLTTLAPKAHELDSHPAILKAAYKSFIQLGGLRYQIPEAHGGFGGQREDWLKLNILLSRYSGALLFLQAQHQFVMSRLRAVPLTPGITQIFNSVVKNNLGYGICFTSGRYNLQVQKHGDFFLLSGKLPWVTGWSFFKRIILSFTYDEVDYYAALPFDNRSTVTGEIELSQPLKISVFNSTQTVTAALSNWQVSPQDIIFSCPSDPEKVITHPTIYNFIGASQALLETAKNGKYFNEAQVKAMFEGLQLDWQDYHELVLKGDFEPRSLRARGLLLASNCALLARIACGAVSLRQDHPVARISREIDQYTVAGYSAKQANAFADYFLSEVTV